MQERARGLQAAVAAVGVVARHGVAADHFENGVREVGDFERAGRDVVILDGQRNGELAGPDVYLGADFGPQVHVLHGDERLALLVGRAGEALELHLVVERTGDVAREDQTHALDVERRRIFAVRSPDVGLVGVADLCIARKFGQRGENLLEPGDLLRDLFRRSGVVGVVGVVDLGGACSGCRSCAGAFRGGSCGERLRGGGEAQCGGEQQCG